MPKKKNVASSSKYKKAPGAPRRFKTAYIFFSESKHKEIRQEEGNEKLLATEITKMVSVAWKALSATEKEPWEQLAREDRVRYDQEKAAYKGPWKTVVPAPPKRPVSAFVAYSNQRRKMVSRRNPALTPEQISGLLGQMWRCELPQVRQLYLNQYAQQMLDFRRRTCEAPGEMLGTAVPSTNAASIHGTTAKVTERGDEAFAVDPISTATTDDGSDQSSEEFYDRIEEHAHVLDPWETFQQRLMSIPNISLTEAIVKQKFVPLTQTDTDCFLTVAAALFEPLESDSSS